MEILTNWNKILPFFTYEPMFVEFVASFYLQCLVRDNRLDQLEVQLMQLKVTNIHKYKYIFLYLYSNQMALLSPLIFV